MLNRIPIAMKTLLKQFETLHPEHGEYQLTDRDGFGTYRTVTFHPDDYDTLTRLAPAFQDERISEITFGEDLVSLTFVTDVRSEHDTPFLLAEVEVIIDGDPEEGETEDHPLTRSELQSTPVAQLREDFPEHAELSKKDLIDAVLADQGNDD